MTSKKLPKISGGMPSKITYEDGRVTSGDVTKQASGSKSLSYNDGRTTSGNTLSQASQPVGKKLYPDTPAGPEGYSLGSLTKKSVH
jgi:hypothetical protein